MRKTDYGRIVGERWLWLAWLVGPSFYLCTFAIIVVAPTLSWGDHPGPDARFACGMIAGHLLSIVFTVRFIVVRSRRLAESRDLEVGMLIVYWVAAAAAFLPVALDITSPETGRVLSWVGFQWVMAVAACAMPLTRIVGAVMAGLKPVGRGAPEEPL